MIKLKLILGHIRLRKQCPADLGKKLRKAPAWLEPPTGARNRKE